MVLVVGVDTNNAMSSFKKLTQNPLTKKWEMAWWIDDHFGSHLYGVKFPDGTIYNPEQVKLKTKDAKYEK